MTLDEIADLIEAEWHAAPAPKPYKGIGRLPELVELLADTLSREGA